MGNCLKKLFKKYVSVPTDVKEHKLLGALGERFHTPNFWHFNRKSVSAGAFAGMFAAFIPLPAQVVIAGALCFLVRGNIPVAATATFITNPFTTIPISFFCYKVGALMLGDPFAADANFSFDFDTLVNEFWTVGKPFFLGCVTVSAVASILSFLAVRTAWSIGVRTSWRRRQLQRASGQSGR
jgi:uncharacterized protein (DUF2062 family)